MTLYSLLLFAHIAGALFLFAGLALEWVLISFLRRNPELAPFSAWGRLFSVAPRLYGPALGVILLSGGYLGAQMRAWEQGWIRVSFVTLFIIGLIGAILQRASRPGDSQAAGRGIGLHDSRVANAHAGSGARGSRSASGPRWFSELCC